MKLIGKKEKHSEKTQGQNGAILSAVWLTEDQYPKCKKKEHPLEVINPANKLTIK